MKLKKSLEFLQRAKSVIPLASQTFSKCHTQLSVGAVPLFLERGVGGHVWDIDGNEYIDQVMSLAPVVLGYQNTIVDEAVQRQIKKGTILSLPGTLEAEVAEKICAIIPNAEMVRYGKNGSDVTAGAVRVARAFTGRDMIACSGYHGWQDWCIGSTTRNKGVPESVRQLTKTFKYNDLESLARIFAEYPNRVAAVVMEPVGVEMPCDNFLQNVKELAHKHGALLIFDEVVTGFRIAFGGAQEYFNVIPDLSCFGKALANGYPLSALVGKREFMKECEEIFFSFTFGGELLSLAAANAVIEIMRKDDVIGYINNLGNEIQNAFNHIASEYGLGNRISAVGYGSHHALLFKDDNGEDDLAAKTVFQEEMVRNGVFTISSNNMCFAHTRADVDHIITAYRNALSKVKSGFEDSVMESLIQGKKLEPVFRKP